VAEVAQRHRVVGDLRSSDNFVHPLSVRSTP
jgi:hypothetical protein